MSTLTPFHDASSRLNSFSSSPPTTRSCRNQTNPQIQVQEAALKRAKKLAIANVKSRSHAFALKLPTRLERPPKEEVDVDMTIQMGDVPIGYVRDKLKESGKRLLFNLSQIRIEDLPSESTQLPASLTIRLPPSPSTPASQPPPTHVLAITPSSSSAASRTYTYFPTHSTVLLTHCAALPTSPFYPQEEVAAEHEASSSKIASDDDIITASAAHHVHVLPVIPLALPHPLSFPILHGYLYTKSLTGLEASLLPSSSSTPSAITFAKQASTIHGLWANACMLRVVGDDPFWDVVEGCWEKVVGQLKEVAKDGMERTRL